MNSVDVLGKTGAVRPGPGWGNRSPCSEIATTLLPAPPIFVAGTLDHSRPSAHPSPPKARQIIAVPGIGAALASQRERDAGTARHHGYQFRPRSRRHDRGASGLTTLQ